MPHKTPRIIPYGDSALLIKYDVNGYDEKTAKAAYALSESLKTNGYWDEVICGYDSVLVSYNPVEVSLKTAQRRIEDKLKHPAKDQATTGKRVDIPVCYGGKHGPDIGHIMAESGLRKDAVIALHSQQDYRVCMMGFIPGFAFLSQAPKALHHPRHDSPRLSVPAGSVGIAGWQTGIYGLESPGGWQIIGRTPLKLFDKDRENPFLLKAGDSVRFVPTPEGDFHD